VTDEAGERLTSCEAKHTTYQPTDAEWECPHCGTRSDGSGVKESWRENHWDTDPGGGEFIIDASVGDPECVLLHDVDFIRCFRCGFETTGKSYAASRKRRAAHP
jgi:rubredoxin